MHDDVVNKYNSAAEDRQAIEQLRDEISGMESNIEQLKEQKQHEEIESLKKKMESCTGATGEEQT